MLFLKGFNIPERQVDFNHNRSSSSKEAPQKDTKCTEITELKTLPSVEKLHMEPTVLLLTDQVDKYFQQRNLDLTKYLYDPKVSSEFSKKMKQTENFKSSKTIERRVSPITLQKQKKGTYVCSAVRNNKSTEKTKEEYKIAAKIAKRDHEPKESKPAEKPLDPGTLTEMPHQISKPLRISQCTSNEAIKSKQNNTTESTLRNTSSTVAIDASTNIPNTSKEHKTEQITNNETIPTLISYKDKRTVIKPKVRIKNDTTINLLPNNLKGHKLIHSILSNIVSTGNTRSAEKMLQTTQPSKKDIDINAMEDTCTVKGLRDQLRVFTIPVNVSNGPFSIGFQFQNPRKYCYSLLRDSPDLSSGNRRQ